MELYEQFKSIGLPDNKILHTACQTIITWTEAAEWLHKEHHIWTELWPDGRCEFTGIPYVFPSEESESTKRGQSYEQGFLEAMKILKV